MPSISSPSFKTQSRSLLRNASRICGSTSAELVSAAVEPWSSSLIRSGAVELRDWDGAQSLTGGVVGDGDMVILVDAGCVAADMSIGL